MKTISGLNLLILIRLIGRISADHHLPEIKEVGFIHPDILSVGEMVTYDKDTNTTDTDTKAAISVLPIYRTVFTRSFSW